MSRSSSPSSHSGLPLRTASSRISSRPQSRTQTSQNRTELRHTRPSYYQNTTNQARNLPECEDGDVFTHKYNSNYGCKSRCLVGEDADPCSPANERVGKNWIRTPLSVQKHPRSQQGHVPRRPSGSSSLHPPRIVPNADHNIANLDGSPHIKLRGCLPHRSASPATTCSEYNEAPESTVQDSDLIQHLSTPPFQTKYLNQHASRGSNLNRRLAFRSHAQEPPSPSPSSVFSSPAPSFPSTPKSNQHPPFRPRTVYAYLTPTASVSSFSSGGTGSHSKHQEVSTPSPSPRAQKSRSQSHHCAPSRVFLGNSLYTPI
ncbi:hypothetical protein C8Q75DRAFT_377476 [Abortiporus biennis]|nr:hypothetical protein C8Q75DRAFT_377476 [Abortiporus biennis]